jgi:hypothetical protein
MQKCENCSSLVNHAVGDRCVDGWLRPDPTGVLRNTMEMTQTSLICKNRMTRWCRTKLKLSGAVRWSEVVPTGQVVW